MPRHGRSFPFRARFRRRTFKGLLGVAGTAAILLDATAGGASIAAAAGTASLAFGATAEGAVGSSTGAGAGTAALIFSGAATGASTAASAGTAAITVGATGAGASTVASAGTGAVVFTATATGAFGSATSAGAGTAALVFGATGTGAFGSSTGAGAGTAAITFGATGVAPGGVTIAAAGTAALTVTATATGSRLQPSAGTAALLVTATGVGATAGATGAAAGTAAIVLSVTGGGAFTGTAALPPPLAYWPFDEASGTVLADASGNGHTATLVHGTWDTSSRKAFGAAALANTDGGLGASFAPITLGTVHSITCWINGWAGVNDGCFIGGTGINEVYVNSTGLYYTAGTANFVTIGHGTLLGRHQVVVTRNGPTVTFYKDGVLLGSRTLGTNNALTVSTISGRADGTYPLVGTIDDLRLYNTALSAAQVAALFALNPDAGLPPVAARVTQLAVDVARSGLARLANTQLAAELLLPRAVPTRVTQEAVEAFTPILILTRNTQNAVEVSRGQPARAGDTQLVVEVFLNAPPCTSGAFPVDTVVRGRRRVGGGSPR